MPAARCPPRAMRDGTPCARPARSGPGHRSTPPGSSRWRRPGCLPTRPCGRAAAPRTRRRRQPRARNCLDTRRRWRLAPWWTNVHCKPPGGWRRSRARRKNRCWRIRPKKSRTTRSISLSSTRCARRKKSSTLSPEARAISDRKKKADLALKDDQEGVALLTRKLAAAPDAQKDNLQDQIDVDD